MKFLAAMTLSAVLIGAASLSALPALSQTAKSCSPKSLQKKAQGYVELCYKALPALRESCLEHAKGRYHDFVYKCETDFKEPAGPLGGSGRSNETVCGLGQC